MRAVRGIAAGLAVAAVLAGCNDEEAVTVASTGAPASAPARYTTDGPGRLLTGKDVDTALVDPHELKGEWADVPTVESGLDLDKLQNVQPKACADWFAGTSFTAPEHSVVTYEVLRKKADSAHSTVFLTYRLGSYKEVSGAATLLTFARRGTKDCSSFTTTLAGNKVDGSVTPMEFQRPGDDSTAYKITLREKTDRGVVVHTAQRMRMQVGHNVVSAYFDSDDEVTDAMMREVLDAGFRRLESSARTASAG